MKLTLQYHAGNPNMCRIPELNIRQMPECEGGGWWMPRGQDEDLLSLHATGTVLTEEMMEAGFNALEEYAAMKADGVFPRPTLIAHIWGRMIEASSNDTNPPHSAPDGEDFSHATDEHDCGEDSCVCHPTATA